MTTTTQKTTVLWGVEAHAFMQNPKKTDHLILIDPEHPDEYLLTNHKHFNFAHPHFPSDKAPGRITCLITKAKEAQVGRVILAPCDFTNEIVEDPETRAKEYQDNEDYTRNPTRN